MTKTKNPNLALALSMPATLLQVAADLPDNATKTQIRVAVRQAGKPLRGAMTFEVACEKVATARKKIDKIRRVRAANAATESGMGPNALQARLEKERRRAFWQAFWSAGYRVAAHREFYSDFGMAAVAQESIVDHNMYSKSYGHPGYWLVTRFTIPADWRTRVERPGLAVRDGLLTMDAVLLDARVVGAEQIAMKIYAAVWLGQGRGNDLHAETGFLAVAGDESYHSTKSPDDAAKGLARKIQAKKIQVLFGRESLGSLVGKALSAKPDLAVRWADAKAVGACTPGIIAWCHQTGIDPDAPEVPLSQIYAAYQKVPAAEARATILRVLRSRARAALVAV